MHCFVCLLSINNENNRYENEEKELEIEIEPGMKDGYQYPFIAEGKGVGKKPQEVIIPLHYHLVYLVEALNTSQFISGELYWYETFKSKHLLIAEGCFVMGEPFAGLVFLCSFSGEPHMDGEPGDLIFVIRQEK